MAHDSRLMGVNPRGREREVSPVKILVVDDEPRLAKSLARLLESQGHAPTTASDGLEAWNLFECEPDAWDLLITDIRMPKLGGVELAHRVRARGSKVPIVFISGHGELPNMPELAPACFLAKPFKHQALLDAMQSSLRVPLSS
jgi:DNA-binding response OmpR family regulator